MVTVLILFLSSGIFNATTATSSGELGGMHYIWWKFNKSSLKSLDFQITIYNNLSTNDGLYLQMYQGKINGIGFYFGLQTRVSKPGSGLTGKGVIFSRWQTKDLSNAKTASQGWSAKGDEGGPFISVRKSYNWTNHKYKIQIKLENSDGVGDWYGIYIQDINTGVTNYCGSLRFPYATDNEKGIADGGGTWTEIYYRKNSNLPLPTLHISIDKVNATSFDNKDYTPRTAFLTCSGNFQHINIQYDEANQIIHFYMGQDIEKKLTDKTITFTDQVMHDYVVIAPEYIANSVVLNNFLSFKRKLGFNPTVVTIESINKNNQGNDTAEKIRNFLKSRYKQWKIKYLLLIGEPYNSTSKTSRSTGGVIPMRYCYPNPEKHSKDYAIPTDYYYADLTGNWDSDKDEYFGEYKQDNVDFKNEIIVGRIPFSDLSTVSLILQKSMNYETRETESKKRILLAGGIENYEEKKM